MKASDIDAEDELESMSEISESTNDQIENFIHDFNMAPSKNVINKGVQTEQTT